MLLQARQLAVAASVAEEAATVLACCHAYVVHIAACLASFIFLRRRLELACVLGGHGLDAPFGEYQRLLGEGRLASCVPL